MGYSFNSLEKVLADRSLFADKKILTLGTLYPFLNANEQARLARRGVDFQVPKEKFSRRLFVDVLGAKCCDSMDVSAYQGSDIICNLNNPIPEHYVGSYDVVIDAGTLEHLSNLSVALINIFSLLRKGGIYYFGVPCNNWVDHGFFQFSPTFFRDLCIDNPGLKLLALHVGTNKRNYDYTAQNSAFIRALFSTRQPLNVAGVICKTGDDISLDLTQSKYRVVYQTSHSELAILTTPVFPLRRFMRAVLRWFITASWLPLSLKELLLNRVYRHKYGSHRSMERDSTG